MYFCCHASNNASAETGMIRITSFTMCTTQAPRAPLSHSVPVCPLDFECHRTRHLAIVANKRLDLAVSRAQLLGNHWQEK
jgi:hypothetical protein